MYASPINVNGLLYEVLSESDLTVKLVGYDKSSPLPPDLVIPSSVSIDGKDYVTRRIAAFAFLKKVFLSGLRRIPPQLQ